MRRHVAWAATVLGVLVAGGLAAGTARSAPVLPPIAPAVLLRDSIAAMRVPPAFSGTLQVQSTLVLPPNPSDPTAPSQLGGHVVRLWHDTPDLWRIASYPAPDSTDTRLTVADGRTVMTWNSQTNTYRTRPQPSGPAAPVPALSTIARRLAEAEASTHLVLDASATVAGRPAYHLVATPTAADVLVGSVQVWIDGRTFLPLAWQMTDRSGATVFSAAFENPIAYGTSPASLFSTQPPAGSKPAASAASGGRTWPLGPGGGTAPGTSGSSGSREATPAEQLAAAQAEVGFPLVQPHWLPTGVVLTGARASGGRAVLRYGRGWQTLILVEAQAGKALPAGQPVAVGGARGVILTDRVVSIVNWVSGGVHHTLAASLEPQVLLRVARSTG